MIFVNIILITTFVVLLKQMKNLLNIYEEQEVLNA